MKPGLRVLSYNIHKGFDSAGVNFVLQELKQSVEVLGADLVLLQEVVGHHDKRRTASQFEYLADRMWPHFAYGRNAVYASGHHGNAILSRYPISFWENQDVTTHRWEKRGLLHAVIEWPGLSTPLHVVCAHLGLLEAGRRSQISKLCRRIDTLVPHDCPLIVGGDFNDWREKASGILGQTLQLEEAFLQQTGSHAKTFPSWLPVLKLDRLYFRGLECRESRLGSEQEWKGLSDHLPIIADFKLAG
jgi:endonuclease/exonuclease/phosphatase family metal-dependent hydrolase